MFLKEALLLLAGLAAGSTVAAGVYAFLVVIGVYPRLIGKTATATKGKIFLYETIIALGGLFGNVVDLFTEKVKQLTGSFLRIAWPAAMPEAELWQKAAEGGGRTGAGAGFLVMLGNVSEQLLLAAAGLSCGIFVGCLVMSLAETLKALPVLSRRLRLAVGLPYLLLAIAAGKNVLMAGISGGLSCLAAQISTNCLVQTGMEEKTAALWTMLGLILLSVILTGANVFQKLARVFGAGVLVPITGFANSVASPALEYKAEGQVFGVGCKIFTIAGPVILYGILSSWGLGVVYWGWMMLTQ